MQLSKLLANSRVNLWWNHLIAPITLPVYLYFYSINEFVYQDYFVFLFASGFLALTGYLINDFFDVKQDELVGKSNLFISLSKLKGAAVLSVSFTIAFIFWWFVDCTPLVKWSIFSAELGLILLYSAPLTRLKENIYLGPLTDALYGHVLPWVAASLVFPFFDQIIIIGVIVLWQFFVGLRNILQHQLDDKHNDLTSGIITFATNNSKLTVEKYIFAYAIFDLIFFSAFVVYFSQTIDIMLLIPFGCALLLELICILHNVKIQGKSFNLPMSLNDLYEYMFPVFLIIYLSFYLNSFSPFFAHLAIFFYSVFKTLMKVDQFSFSISGPRLVVNYAIYFLFKRYGIDLIKEETTAFQYLKKKFFS